MLFLTQRNRPKQRVGRAEPAQVIGNDYATVEKGVRKGKINNPRKQVKFGRAKGRDVVTYLYDIVMENELSDCLQYDFGLTK